MKLSKRILAVLLAGTMALALLAGCGSSVGSKDVDVINVMLQLNGSDVKVTEDASLKADADRFVSLLQKLVPFEAAPNKESTVREENYKVTAQQDKEFPWSNELKSTRVAGKSKRLVLVSDNPRVNKTVTFSMQFCGAVVRIQNSSPKPAHTTCNVCARLHLPHTAL